MALLPSENRRGQRLSAANWNASVGAITRHDNALQRILPNGSTLRARAQPGVIVKIHNNTGGTLAPRYVGGIDTHAFTGDPENITLTVVTPEEGVHDGAFVVTIDSIPDGGIGRAVLSGAALCVVTMNDDNHQFARVTDGDSAKLQSSPAGTARILWHEELSGSGVEDVLALVEYPLDGPAWVWEATADESSGEITAKRIDSTGALVGSEITFTVLPD